MKKYLGPLLVWAALAAAVWPLRRYLTAEAVAAWTPGQTGLAVLILLALYVVKGLTAALPLTALAGAAGLLLPFPAALGTNLGGALAAQAGPYFLGRAGKGNLGDLAKRLPGLRGPAPARQVFLLRLAGGLPPELVSLWVGGAGAGRRARFAGGLLGGFPRVLAGTVRGGGGRPAGPISPGGCGGASPGGGRPRCWGRRGGTGAGGGFGRPAFSGGP